MRDLGTRKRQVMQRAKKRAYRWRKKHAAQQNNYQQVGHVVNNYQHVGHVVNNLYQVGHKENNSEDVD